MKIYIDADACPNAIKEILFKVARNRRIAICFVANRVLHLPKHPLISSIQVSQGFDVADDEIVARVNKNDLVITQDIPLAHEILIKGANAMTPRGLELNLENIKEKLAVRDLKESLRSFGQMTGGPSPQSPQTIQSFANTLDRMITRLSNL